MRINARSPVLTYGLASISVAAVFAILLLGGSGIQAEGPYLLFLASVLMSAWFGGLGPGLFATFSSFVLANTALPFASPDISGPAHWLYTASYLLIGSWISWVVESLRGRAELNRKAEEALQVDKKKLEEILDSMREGICITDNQNVIEYANPALQKQFGAIQGRRCHEYLHGRGETCAGCTRPEILAGRSIQREWHSSPGGKDYDVFETALVNADGSIAKLKILHDVTGHKRAEEKLQRLSSELLNAQEAERLRLSKELHDELGQILTVIKLRLGLIDMNLRPDQQQLKQHCDSVSDYIDQVIDAIRRLSRDLCPALLENVGVTTALQRLANESERAGNIRMSLEMDDIDSLFPYQSRIVLYRIFQESLTNIIRHSGARGAIISAKRHDGKVNFEVVDDGRGMDLQQHGKNGEHGMGLLIMRERVRSLGSSLEMWSQRGMGTRLSFSVPVEEVEDGGGQV